MKSFQPVKAQRQSLLSGCPAGLLGMCPIQRIFGKCALELAAGGLRFPKVDGIMMLSIIQIQKKVDA